MELVKPDGRLVSGMLCIYHVGGIVLYSEEVHEDGDSYIFDPAKTVCLLFSPPDPRGQQQVQMVKGFGPIPLMPSTLRAGRAGVIVTDCTDPNIVKLCKQALSGIVIAPPHFKVPVGEKEH